MHTIKNEPPYLGKIRATVLDKDFNVLESAELSMRSRDGRFRLRGMANKAHKNGKKLLTEPLG